MNFIGDDVGEKFLHEIRVCENYLAQEEPMTLEPAYKSLDKISI